MSGQGMRRRAGAARVAVEHSARAEAAGIRLKDVVWLRPLVAGEGPLEVHTGLYPEDDGSIGYEIYSGAVDESEKPVLHGRGRVVLESPGARPSLDLEALKAGCQERIMVREACYGAFRTRGLDYGPAHQGLESLAMGRDVSGRLQALARLALPECIAETRDDYVLHPAIMDVALQSVAGLSLEKGAGVGRPYAVDGVRIWTGSPEKGWAWARNNAVPVQCRIALNAYHLWIAGRLVAFRGRSFAYSRLPAVRTGDLGPPA